MTSGYGHLGQLDPGYRKEVALADTPEKLRAISFRPDDPMQYNYIGLYKLSKAMLNQVTCIAAKEFADDLVVYSVCPGWVQTRQGGEDAARTIPQGGKIILWAINDAPAAKSGCFIKDRLCFDL